MTIRLDTYLDIWRGAFYSVMLGAIYHVAIFSNRINTNLYLMFTILVTIFLISDGVSRYNSRVLIRKHSTETNDLNYWEVIWLIIEMVGLLIFVSWIIYILPEPSNNFQYHDILVKNNILIGLFCLFNFFHNSFMIKVDKDVSFTTYTKLSIFHDASEIKNFSKHWAEELLKAKGSTVQKFKKVFDNIDNGKADISSLLKAGFNVIILFIVQSIKLSFIHFIIQYSALRIFIFNLIASFFIIFLPYNISFFYLVRDNYLYFIPISIVLCLFLYFISSTYELRSYDPKNYATPNSVEKFFQSIGNIILIFFLIILLATLKKYILISIVLFENAVFSFLLIYNLKTS